MSSSNNQIDWPMIIIIVSIIALIGGIGLIANASSESKLLDDSSKTPEEITLAQLIKRGPNGNNNVIVTNFNWAPNYVYTTYKGSWNSVWIPIVPADNSGQPGFGGAPAVVKALVKSTKASNKNDVEMLATKTKLRGMVINKIDSVSGDAKNLLENTYKGSDMETCIIIQEGREPSTKDSVNTMRFFGIILIPVSILLGVFGGYLKAGGGISRKRRSSTLRKKSRPIEREAEREKPRSRRRVEEDDEPPRRRRVDDDDEPPRRRRVDDEDEDRTRSRRRLDDDDRDEDRRRRRDDDDDRPPPRRRSD